MDLSESCIKCLTNGSSLKGFDKASPEVVEKFRLEVEKLVLNARPDYSGPVLAMEISHMYSEKFGRLPVFTEEKIKFNNICLSYEDRLTEIALNSDNPIRFAVGLCQAGNIIDFGVMKNVSEDLLEFFVNAGNNVQEDDVEFRKLYENLSTAKNLAYITDNSGEIVMDKILIKLIQKSFPEINITAVVRGGEILNDATMEDAKFIGLDKICRVIDNGTDIPGTSINYVSENCRKTLESADMIISKGLGNLETIFPTNLNVYFIFMSKCQHISETFGFNKNDLVISSEKALEMRLKH